MTLATSEQRYQRGDAGAAQLQEVIDEILEQLAQPDSEAAQAARNADLQPAELSGVRIEVREAEQGAEPVLTTIVVGIAVAAGSKIAGTLWDEVIWPARASKQPRRGRSRVLDRPQPDPRRAGTSYLPSVMDG